MKKLKKIIGITALVLLLGIFAVFFYIDSIAKFAVEEGGTMAMGVKTTVQKMSVGVFSGECAMNGLQVNNPSGEYESPHFLRQETGEVAVSLGSLMEDTVVIPKLLLDGISVHFEKGSGKGNFEQIMDNLKAGESSEPAATTEASASGEGKKFKIGVISIKNVNVHAAIAILGSEKQKVNLTIPEITLRDVGSDSDGGVLLREVIHQVVKAILASTIEHGGPLPTEILESLKSGFRDLKPLKSLGKNVLEDLQKNVEAGDLKKTAEDLKQSGKNIEKEAKKKLGELEGLFKKKKKE